MRWDVVVEAWLGLITPDSDVQDVLGDSPEFWMAGERKFVVPSLEYQIISDGEVENFEVTLVQLDFFVEAIADLVKLEKALRRILHHDTPITADGHGLWSQLVGGGPLQGPDDGNLRRHLDFRLTYLRSRYA